MWYIFLLSFCCVTVSSNDGSQILRTNSLVLDNFIERLNIQKWNKKETQCFEDILTILKNVKNSTLWATWIWNANALPSVNLYGTSASLGNFDQCIKPPWLITHPQFTTKYCLATFSLPGRQKHVAEFDPYGSTTDFIKSKTTLAAPPTNRLLWGMCVPVSCKPLDALKISRAMYEFTHLRSIRPNITIDYCHVAGEKTQYTTSFYLFWTVIILLLVIVIASTARRNYMSNDVQKSDLEGKILDSFCLVQNYQRLTEENEQEIRVLNGIRFITALIVVSLHEAFYLIRAVLSNTWDSNKDLSGVVGLYCHVDVVVDTFYAMSGLLIIKSLLAKAEKQQNLLMVLWKRYIRLIGPYALTIFYVTAVSEYTGSGPIWQLHYGNEAKTCSRTWKLSLLMLNTNEKDLCHEVTWYVSSDYQLGILATVIFYFYRKDRKLGFVVYGIAAALSLIIPGILTYWYELPAFHFVDMSNFNNGVKNFWAIGYTYTPSYSRAGAYLVGVAMGYFMTVCNPMDYRKTISKTWSILGTVASLVVMVYVMALGQIYVGRKYYPLEAAVITATNRVAWAITVCCIIGFCVYGTVPLVTNILSSSVFTPLSRLSYNVYLVHTLIIQRNKFSLRSPLKYDKFSIATDTVGTLTVSLAISFVLWLLVEAPMISLCNQIFFAKEKCKSKETEKNGVLISNGKAKAKGL